MTADLPSDLVQGFQVEASGLRGRLVQLGPVVDEIIGRHGYPEPVAALLAEALVLAATLASALKFDGVFTLQTRGDGPVSMLVADYRTPGTLRGYAQVDLDKLEAALAREDQRLGSVPRLIGAGHLAFTVDQGEHTERYQGIVELTGATLAECAHRYFQQSEQIGTGIRVAAGRVDGRWRAGGLMLQRLPSDNPNLPVDEATEDAWRRAVIMMSSARDDELLDPGLQPTTLLFRLFHEDGVRVWDPTPVVFGCRCSTERVQGVLRSFTVDEIRDMSVDGQISVTCEFCSTRYEFPATDFLP